MAAAATLLGLASLPLYAQQIQAQAASGAPVQEFAVTSASSSAAADLARVNALIAERVRAGELVATTPLPDRRLPGRVHEHFQQVHDGVPILGAGLARQRTAAAPVGAATLVTSAAGGMGTISVFGRLIDDVDVDTEPSLSAAAAVARMEAIAGTARATGEPPRLAVLPTPLGKLALTWSAPMRDFRTWFIDAHGGEPVYRMDHVHHESAVGFGRGVTGAPQKLSTWKNGDSYQAWDRLRPAEIVTLDAAGGIEDAFALIERQTAWRNAVATDDDNQWSSAAVVDGHAHLGLTYDYLLSRHGWRGMNGRDGRVFSIVNIDNYGNAFFVSAPFGPERTGAVAFGHTAEATPLVPLDIVAHEFMHGVTHSALVARTGMPFFGMFTYTLGPSSIRFRARDDAGRWREVVVECGGFHTYDEGEPAEQRAPFLCYDANGQPTRSRQGRLALFLNHSGAINEAYSDIIATAVEFAFHPPGSGAQRADYLIAEDARRPFRRLDAPLSQRLGAFTYPDAAGQEYRFLATFDGNRIRFTRFGMKDGDPFGIAADDYTGVHWNSTILSHAFYLAIEGGRHGSTGRTVQGVGGPNRTQVEQAFFRALVDLAPPRASFAVMGAAVRQAAIDLHGAGSSAHAAIDQALTAVGL